jgi:hypothetical protein
MSGKKERRAPPPAHSNHGQRAIIVQTFARLLRAELTIANAPSRDRSIFAGAACGYRRPLQASGSG